MSVGQALGTLSFATFCAAVVIDLRRARILAREAARFSTMPPPPSKPPGGGE
jgi:hypothetical protein